MDARAVDTFLNVNLNWDSEATGGKEGECQEFGDHGVDGYQKCDKLEFSLNMLMCASRFDVSSCGDQLLYLDLEPSAIGVRRPLHFAVL